MYSRQAYLRKLDLAASQVDEGHLMTAAVWYEQDIYEAIGVKPFESNPWVSGSTEFILGSVISACFGTMLGYAFAPFNKKDDLPYEEKPGMPRNKNFRDKLFTRRGFLGLLGGAGLVALWGLTNSRVTPVTQTVLRIARTTINDKNSVVDDWKDILERRTGTGPSQQILQVNRENEDKIGI